MEEENTFSIGKREIHGQEFFYKCGLVKKMILKSNEVPMSLTGKADKDSGWCSLSGINRIFCL